MAATGCQTPGRRGMMVSQPRAGDLLINGRRGASVTGARFGRLLRPRRQSDPSLRAIIRRRHSGRFCCRPLSRFPAAVAASWRLSNGWQGGEPGKSVYDVWVKQKENWLRVVHQRGICRRNKSNRGSANHRWHAIGKSRVLKVNSIRPSGLKPPKEQRPFLPCLKARPTKLASTYANWQAVQLYGIGSSALSARPDVLVRSIQQHRGRRIMRPSEKQY